MEKVLITSKGKYEITNDRVEDLNGNCKFVKCLYFIDIIENKRYLLKNFENMPDEVIENEWKGLCDCFSCEHVFIPYQWLYDGKLEGKTNKVYKPYTKTLRQMICQKCGLIQKV